MGFLNQNFSWETGYLHVFATSGHKSGCRIAGMPLVELGLNEIELRKAYILHNHAVITYLEIMLYLFYREQ